jgi:hypothetical protein
MKISDLIDYAELVTDRDIDMFHALRVAAFGECERIYKDRETSYNVDVQPTEEMVYGPVSLASEMFKRVRRMTSILSPRKPELEPKDLDRLEDTCVDLMNYASWQWALIKMAKTKAKKAAEAYDETKQA